MKQITKLSKKIRYAMLSFIMIASVLITNNVFATGNANIVIRNTATSNGSWAFASGTYTFTPSANSAGILNTDISNCMLGTGTVNGGALSCATNGKGNVVILTACSGTGSQNGDVTTSNGISVSVNSAAQLTLTIIAAGAVNISQAISISAATGGTPGYPGANLKITAGGLLSVGNNLTSNGAASSGTGNGGVGGSFDFTCATISYTQPISTTGGNGTTTGNAGNGGNIKITVTGGAFSRTNSITSNGGAGAGSGAGGKGGVVTLTCRDAYSASTAANIKGGAGGATGNGGNGGTLRVISTTSSVTHSSSLSMPGGVGGSTSGNGGTGGNVSYRGVGTVTHTGGIADLAGGTVTNGIGGNGGYDSLVSTASNVLISNAMDARARNGVSGNNNGGNGGTFVFSAATSFQLTGGTITNSGGNGVGSGTGGSNGAITINCPGGFKSDNAIVSIAGTGGTPTKNNFIINDGYSFVVSPNDGHTSNNWGANSHSLIKTGSGIYYEAVDVGYTGNTIITEGTIRTGRAVAPSAVGSFGNSANAVQLNGGAIEFGSTCTRALSVTANGSRIDAYGAARTITAAISGTGAYILGVGGITNGTTSGQVLTLSGAITNGTSTLGIEKVLTSTVVLSGTSNTYTGGTKLTAGILQMGATNCMPSSGQVVMNGGTVATTAANGQTMGTLMVNASTQSTISLFAGSHTLQFAASASANGITWGSGGVLIITGWAGSWNGTTGTSGKVFVGSSASGLDASQVAQIQFYNSTTKNYHNATILSSGEIVPKALGFTTVANGSWTSNTTWGTTAGLGVGITYPGASDNVQIAHNITDLGGANQACRSVYFSNGSGQTVALGNYNLTINGNFTYACNPPTFTSSGGYVVIGGGQTCLWSSSGCALTIPYLRLSNNSNIIITSSSSNLTIGLNLDCQSGTSNITVNGGSTTLAFTAGATCTAPNCNFTIGQTPTYVTPFNFTNCTGGTLQVGDINFSTTYSPGNIITFGSLNFSMKSLFMPTNSSASNGNTLTATGTITATGTLFLDNSFASTTIANLKLGGSSATRSGVGALTITNFDMNSQTGFTLSGIGTTTVATSLTNAGSMNMAYSGTPTFVHQATAAIPGGSYYNLTTSTNAKTIACGVTVTTDGKFTNSTTITGPTTTGQWARFVNASPVVNSGTIGGTNNNISFSSTIAGGTITGNILQNSSQIAVCGSLAPTLTAAVGATVDAPFDVTFTDDATWRGAITSITVNGTTLTAGYSVSSGKITFTPSASNPANLLQTAGASKSIIVYATNYTNATVSQTVSAGADSKLVMGLQPTAPSVNGGTLAQQPTVLIQDQYSNTTASTASVTAAVGAGSWTIGGAGNPKAAVAGTATFTDLTATSAAAVTGASINFTCGSLTSVTSNTFNIPAPPAPALTPAGSATVDAPFDVTFTDDATWRAAITSITINGTTLDAAGYSVTSGKITFTPSASNPTSLLQTAGTNKSIVVIATGYANGTVSQTILAGTATKLGMGTQPTAPALNGDVLAQQPSVLIQDQYGNTTTSTASVTATVGAGSWTIGGAGNPKAAVAGTATFTNLTATSSSAVTGATITFTSGSLASTTSNTFNIPIPPTVVISSPSQIASGLIMQNSTKNALSAFQFVVTDASAVLTGIVFTTTNTPADITKFQVWSNTTNNLSTATIVGSDVSNTSGIHTLSGFTKTFTTGTIYLWITADITSTATFGNTVVVSSIANTDFTFTSANKSGSVTTGNTQTISYTVGSACGSSAVVVDAPAAPNTTTGITLSEWSKAPTNTIAQTISGTIQTGSTWQAMFDATNIYVLVRVKDANLSTANDGNNYNQDGIEMYYDPNNTKNGCCGYTTNPNQSQSRFLWNATAGATNPITGTNPITSLNNKNWVMTDAGFGGYDMAVTVPWSTMGSNVNAIVNNRTLGFEININDQQNGAGAREATVGWNGTNNDDWQNPSGFGTVTLSVCGTPTVSSPTVTAITTTGATLGATVTAINGGTLTAGGVAYNTSTGVTNQNPTAISGAPSLNTAFTQDITGLSPQTHYYFVGYASRTNVSASVTGISTESDFYTLSNAPTVQASSLNASIVSGTQVDLSWTGATYPGSGATNKGYVILRATSPNTPSLGSSNGAAPSAGANTTLITNYDGTGTPSVSTSDNSLSSPCGNTYNYLVVPYTWNGSNAGTYNYLTSSAPTASVTYTAPTVTADGAATVCSGNSVNISADGASTYAWSESLGSGTPKTVNPTTTTTYVVTGTAVNSCTNTAQVIVTIRGGATQTSANATDWNTASTWTSNEVPLTCDDVVIDNNVTINSGVDVVCVALTINNGKALTATTGNLSVNGDFTNNGTFTHNSGTVTFAGTTTVSGTSTTTFNNVVTTGTLTGHATDMNIAGNWTNNGSYTHNSGRINFTGITTYSGSSNATLFKVEIKPNNSLKVASGKTITMDSTLYIRSTDPHNMGQLVMENNSAYLVGGTNNKRVYVEVYDTLNTWHYISSPIYNGAKGAQINLFGYYVQKYNEPTQKWVALVGKDSLRVGVGYSIKYSTYAPSRTITFKEQISKLHNGTITLSLTNTAGSNNGGGWNLVGNPYPCAIDWAAAEGWNNTNVDPTYYVWDGVLSRYATYNKNTSISTNMDNVNRGGQQFIPAMQGFYIFCSDGSPTFSGSGTLSMDNRVRTDSAVYSQNRPFWFWKKGAEQNTNPLMSSVFSLKVSGNGYSDESMIGFKSDATGSFDRDYDAYKLISPVENVPQINTTTLDDYKMQVAINFLPQDYSQKSTVPLQFTVGQAGTYTISSNNALFDPSVMVTLEDVKTGKMTDLQNATYTFKSEAVTNENRFLIHFGAIAPTSVKEKELNELVTIYTDKNNIVIRNTSNVNEKGLITIYDMLGKEVSSRELTPNSLTSIEMNDKAQSVYFVRIMTDNKTFTKKVCITR